MGLPLRYRFELALCVQRYSPRTLYIVRMDVVLNILHTKQYAADLKVIGADRFYHPSRPNHIYVYIYI